MPPIIILGTGLAGYNLAREFRKLDKQTPLRLITRDDGCFYSKPMLSNALATGKTPTSLVMRSVEAMAEELAADISPWTAVEKIDAEKQQIWLQGQALSYRQLVLALGADPIDPGLTGNAVDEVLQVNDLRDYGRFRERLEGARSLIILGGGLIGCEFADDLAGAGFAVTILDPGRGPLGRLLPAEAATYMAAQLTARGVDCRWGRKAGSVERSDGKLWVTLDDDSRLAADVVFSAIGLRPRTALAAAAGLAVGRGIQVDRMLQASVPGVYALGDCAEVAGLNLPFVLPIMQCARALAKTLAGEATPVNYPAMPVVVKTPSCPCGIAPPPVGAAGAWHSEVTPTGVKSLYLSPAGQLLGFAVLGDVAGQRQTLAKELPAWLV